MLTPQQHIDQARANDDLAAELAASHPSWAVTLLYYAALHWISAYLAAQKAYPQSHVARRQAILRYAAIRTLDTHYRALEDDSRQARYECVAYQTNDVQRLRRQRYNPIRDKVRQLLNVK